jgi:hypothetical protein
MNSKFQWLALVVHGILMHGTFWVDKCLWISMDRIS